MRNVRIFLVFLGLQGTVGAVGAQTLMVNSLRYWTQPAEARLVLDTTTTPVENVALLQNPPRLAIRLNKARLANNLGQPSGGNRFFSRFYTEANENDNLTVFIGLKKQVAFKSFTLPPNKTFGHRLVIDVFDTEAPLVADNGSSRVIIAKSSSMQLSEADLNARLAQNFRDQKIAKPYIEKSASRQSNVIIAQPLAKNSDNVEPFESSAPISVSRKSNGKRASAKEIIVAIDAGHGGKDPGSHGAAGTEEKQVVFEIAQKLQRLIAQQPGMTPVMVRNGDQFIKLRQRMQIARAAKADLFVSIHADAFTNSSVKGASVFTLSNRGATSEAARWLANNENAADLVGGVSLDDKDDMLASVLLDLSQTATTEASGNVAKKVLANFRDINPLHKSAVQKAGFMVLKSPDIPSILVETAFISNPEEEQKLRSDSHQAKVAKAIFNGIVAYFKQYAPLNAPATRVAEVSEIDKG